MQIAVILFVLFFSLSFISSAYAYFDGGSGSYIFQVVISFVIGILFVIKGFFRRIAAFFMNKRRKKDCGKND